MFGVHGETPIKNYKMGDRGQCWTVLWAEPGSLEHERKGLGPSPILRGCDEGNQADPSSTILALPRVDAEC